MAAFNKFNDFTEQLVRGVHDWDAHTFKVALTNTSPAASDVSFLPGSSHPAPTNTNGYTTGGGTTTITVAETSGTTTVQGTQVVFTATAGGIGQFRYVILYNDTATSPADAVIGYWDYGSSISLADGESFTVQFNSASPGTIFTLA